MNVTPTLASAPQQAVRAGAPAEPAEASRRHYGLATLRSIVATWRRRTRFRRELKRISEVSTHLIDDIGLTRQQAETEIAKPFWQR